jgi:hypothetical protein
MRNAQELQVSLTAECTECRELVKEWERAKTRLAHRGALAHLSERDSFLAKEAAEEAKKARDRYFEHRATHR